MIGSFLSAVDGALAFLPAWFRLCLWGAASGGGAMLLYGWLSPQERLAELQGALEEARERIQLYGGEDVREIGALVKRSLLLSFTQVRLVLVPTVLAAVPVLLAIVWLDAAYSHTLPEPGTPVAVRYWTATGADPAPGSPVAWPRPSEPVTLEGPAGTELLTLPLEQPRARLARRTWWNDFFRSPVGYLPEESRVAVVTLELPRRRFFPFGPTWAQGWQALFLAVLAVSAAAVKYGRGIR